MHKELHIYSEGQRLLRELVYADEYRVPAVTVAERCGVPASTVSRWCRGFLRPQEAHKIILEQRYRIPAAAWDQPPKGAAGAA